MKIAIMQPYIFPYIGYWQLINAVDTFILYDDVNFINRGWINRNNILVNNNKYLFTLPLENRSQHRLIKDIILKEFDIEKNKLLKSISYSYSKAPYFEQVFSLIKECLNIQSNSLVDLIEHSIHKVNEYLGITTKIEKASSLPNGSVELKAEQRIINIVEQLQGNIYINAIGGKELYDVDNFLRRGIQLRFLKTNSDINYKQFSNDFISGLSIIDVLMFNDKVRVMQMLDQYELL